MTQESALAKPQVTKTPVEEAFERLSSIIETLDDLPHRYSNVLASVSKEGLDTDEGSGEVDSPVPLARRLTELACKLEIQNRRHLEVINNVSL